MEKCYYDGIETLYQMIFKKRSSLYLPVECLLLKAAGNSDSQNTILETTKCSGSWGKKVVLYLLDKVWSQQLINFQIDSSEYFS